MSAQKSANQRLVLRAFRDREEINRVQIAVEIKAAALVVDVRCAACHARRDCEKRDGWFREYLFRLVPEKKYVPEATLQLMNQTPVRLPAWDPLFQGEE